MIQFIPSFMSFFVIQKLEAFPPKFLNYIIKNVVILVQAIINGWRHMACKTYTMLGLLYSTL